MRGGRNVIDLYIAVSYIPIKIFDAPEPNLPSQNVRNHGRSNLAHRRQVSEVRLIRDGPDNIYTPDDLTLAARFHVLVRLKVRPGPSRADRPADDDERVFFVPCLNGRYVQQ
jgi:hypothetical protein